MRTFEENIGEITRLSRPGPVRPVHGGLLAFPARLLAGLPAAVRLDLVDRAGRPIVVATGAEDAERLRGLGATVIDAGEWAALAEGAESDRVFAEDVPVLLALRGPGRITAELALAGAQADPPRGWSVATVLARLGLEPAVNVALTAPANGEHRARESAREAA